MIWIFCLLLLGSASIEPLGDWNRFEKAVRDQTLQKTEARKQFPGIYAELKKRCAGYPFEKSGVWVFPVQGYGPKDAGAGGFRPDIRYGSPIRGYDFYDGNRHGGHPAYDIFIRDRERDGLDDRTRQPAEVLAPVDLLILSAEDGWRPGSEIRGGNYIWALDPLQDRIFYFAHLEKTSVKEGDFRKAGSMIGTVGRSGKNAFPLRSPTHLHLMVLNVEESGLTPLDFLPFLKGIGKTQ